MNLWEECVSQCRGRPSEGKTYVGDGGDGLAFEVAPVDLFDGCLEVIFGLILHKTRAVALTRHFRIDDVEAVLASEVLQVLCKIFSSGASAEEPPWKL